MAEQVLRHADFRRVDLNLLVAFDALMTERHVGKAAARVFIGQPAMSYALSKLRDALEDDLFVRSGAKMEPTAMALALAPRVRAWLDDANGFLFARDKFDLSHVNTTIRIGTALGLEVVLLPSLMEVLRNVAPGIRIRTELLQREDILANLDAEEVDVAFGPGLLPFREWHCHEIISRTHYECVYSPDQVNLPEVITPEVLAKYEHIAFNWGSNAGAEIEGFFAAQGLQRKVIARLACQVATMRILMQSPVISLQSSMITSTYRETPGIAVRAVPAIDIALNVHMIWHRRNDKQPAQMRVRKIIQDILLRKIQADMLNCT